eukprot:Clim_evm46s158 gene=Clim_evmTU46s158
MGVTAVFKWGSNPNNTQHENMAAVEALLKDAGAKRVGPYVLQAHYYAPRTAGKQGAPGAPPQPQSKPQQPLYRFTFSDKAIKTVTFSGEQSMEIDKGWDEIINRLKGEYGPRREAVVNGYTYSLGDFLVKIGMLTPFSPTSVGLSNIIVCVEYVPCVSLSQARELLTALANQLLPLTIGTYDPFYLQPNTTGNIPQFNDASACEYFTLTHTAVQYLHQLTSNQAPAPIAETRAAQKAEEERKAKEAAAAAKAKAEAKAAAAATAANKDSGGGAASKPVKA